MLSAYYYYVCMLICFGHIRFFVTLWTVAFQAPLEEYCSGLPCPPPGDLPDPGIKPVSLKFPALAGGFFTTSAMWEAWWLSSKESAWRGELGLIPGSGRLPWGKEWLPTPVFLPGEFRGQRSLAGCGP